MELIHEAVLKALKLKLPAARIERLRRHEELRDIADVLAVELEAATTDLGKRGVLHSITEAEGTARELDDAPYVEKQKALLEKRRQPRSGHRLSLDAWLDDLPDVELEYEQLLQLIPESGADEVDDCGIYREIVGVVWLIHDVDRPKAKPVQYDPKTDSGFKKAVRRARKRR